jgi:hypothetical protein
MTSGPPVFAQPDAGKPDLLGVVVCLRPEPRDGDPHSVWRWHIESRPTLEERREWLARCPQEFRAEVRKAIEVRHAERKREGRRG